MHNRPDMHCCSHKPLQNCAHYGKQINSKLQPEKILPKADFLKIRSPIFLFFLTSFQTLRRRLSTSIFSSFLFNRATCPPYSNLNLGKKKVERVPVPN
jgi:hypothetical protein